MFEGRNPVIQERINRVITQVEVPQTQHGDKVADVPVVAQRQVPIIQKAQKTIEMPQTEAIDKDTVDVPVVMQRHVPVIQNVQETAEVPQVQYLSS